MFTKHRYVYAVYKEKSFTRAAEKLYISQPSLSAAIKGIEEKVGAPLFERSGQGVRLTEIGKEYIAVCEKMMNAEKEFAERLCDICNLETGHIAVGGSNYISSYVLPGIINSFSRLYPKISVTLTEAHSSTLSEMVKNETVDIIIDSFYELPDMYEGEALAHENILLCVPQKFEINKKLSDFSISPENIYSGNANINEVPRVPVEVFAKEKFVLLKSGNDMYDRAMTILSDGGVSPDVAFSVDQLNISYTLASLGMGVCFVTDTLFKYITFNKNVLLYNVGKKPYSRTLYIARKKNRYCTRSMSEFIRVAKDVITK